ncbi:MAG: PspA/IM30 family protein [Adlercreutzia sp.]|nr:PspA/IM30 family protein [Adlercreutzia sp.]
MGILDRFTSIVKANINELLDKAEDPEKMVDQYLREMTESLAEVREATAGVMAEEKRTKKLVDDNMAEMAKYEDLAKKALAAGNEGDARTFLAKKQELAGRTEGLTIAYEGAKANADKMRLMHDKLVKDIEELNARKATIKAKAAVAKTQAKVNDMTSAGDRAEGARSAFDRMEAKADEMLDRANAVAELSEKPADPTAELEKKYEQAGVTAAVDDDLARLKKEMGLD